MRVNLTVNGRLVPADIEPDTLLIDVLRGHGLTGTKEGCSVGVCGACTVVIGDLPVSSCLYLAACAEGAEVWTVEGLTERDDGLVDAFVRQEGFQCGICTPGQVVAAYTLRREMPDADEDDIRAYMAGNLCRCTGYDSIVASVRAYLARP